MSQEQHTDTVPENTELQQPDPDAAPASTDTAPAPDTAPAAPAPKRRKLSRAWKAVLWLVLTPLLLFLLAAAALYLPPVQRWAVDKACATLSESTGMTVTVEQVRLTFPLDLYMGHTTAVQQADTLVDAAALDLSIRLLPLFRAQVDVDHITLSNAHLNTRDLVAALRMEGHIGRLNVNAHDIRLRDGVANVDHIALRNANLFLALADSVPEDTSASEPLRWVVRLHDVAADQVRLRLLMAPQRDSMRVDALLGQGRLAGELNLETGAYAFSRIRLHRSRLALDLAPGHATNGFDPTHVRLTDVDAFIPHVRYNGVDGSLSARIDSLSARERSGIRIQQLSTGIEMDTTQLTLNRLLLRTPESHLGVQFRMDLNAFDTPTATQPDLQPGTFEVRARGSVGKDDIVAFASPYVADIRHIWPAAPLHLRVQADGNMEALRVSRLTAAMPGHFEARGKAQLMHLTRPDALPELTSTLQATLHRPDLLMGFVPAESRAAFTLPRELSVAGRASLLSDVASFVGSIGTPAGSALLDAAIGLRDESYRAVVSTQNLSLNQFLPLTDAIALTAKIDADGRGFDFFSTATSARADAAITAGHFGSYNLSNLSANLQLLRGSLSGIVDVDNPQLTTSARLSGKMLRDALDANLTLQLPFADLRAMGLADDVFTVSTQGTFNLTSDLKHHFNLTAGVDGLDLHMGADRITTDRFDLTAITQRDTTYARLRTGDLRFDFYAPESAEALMARAGRIEQMFKSQLKTRDINIALLKQHFPTAHLAIEAGTQNPVADILRIQGIRFGGIHANLTSSPADGLGGYARAAQIRTEGFLVDSVFLTLRQDSTRLTLNSGLRCKDQESFPAFRATLDGYIAPSNADLRLRYYDKRERQGIDLGLHALATDTALHASFYPEQPIIGFRPYKLNDDNYLTLDQRNRLSADIRLTSTNDASAISIQAAPADTLEQNIRAIVRQLDIASLLEVLPGMPKMKGKLNLDANYEQTAARFWVRGTTGIDAFEYEGTPVGDVSAVFDYTPAGADQHKVDATLSHNQNHVAFVSGLYNASGAGALDATVRLDSLPLSMTAPFIPDQMVVLGGTLGGEITARGPLSRLDINGQLLPQDMTCTSDIYGIKLRMENAPIQLANSTIRFNQYKVYATDDTPLTLNGNVDFSNTDAIAPTLSLYGRNFKLIDAKRNRRSVVFGDMYGDFFARVNGTLDDLRMRGVVKVLNTSDLTYVLEDTPLTIDDRLSDIVTFVDFSAPPDTTVARERRTFSGMDMQLTLSIEDGAMLRAEFSADKQSYVNVKGEGNLVLNSTPEGPMSLTGRYTVSEGQMKYTLPVIPLKTFTITPGSYIAFTGDPMNPSLSFAATEQTNATVSTNGTSRSVTFNTGLSVNGTLEDMELLFTIEAPEDISVQNELAAMPKEDKNKLAVGLLCTGLYMSASNTSGISANNALNNFLQNEINNIAGKALATTVEMNVGMEQTTRDDGTSHTDYSFKFSKRFFSNRLNVVIGGKVSADGNTPAGQSGAYIDDVSLEWRLDNAGSRYVKLYRERNYDNLVEGELSENGGSLLIRKKLDKLSELLIWRRKETGTP